jgi:hypothetical protein
MTSDRHRTLAHEVWIAFIGLSIVGIVTGFIRGTGEMSDIAFGIVAYGLPIIFTLWGVVKIDRRSLGEITGHTRWRAEERQRDREIGLSDGGDGANAMTGDGTGD